MVKKISSLLPRSLITLVLLLYPFIVIILIGNGLLLKLVNPATGDLVAMPEIVLPLSNLLYPWINNFAGSFGGHYVPHVLLSQLVPYVSSTVLQFVYSYFIFVVLFIVFIDFFSKESNTKGFLNHKTVVFAGLVILVIFFSTVFTINAIQGNPDIYYAFLFSIPCILYLYAIFKDRTVVPVLKFSLVLSLAIAFAQFSPYYIGITLIPYFLLFVFLFRKQLRSVVPLLGLLLFLILLTNLPTLYTTFKPALSAIGHVVSKDSSVTSVLSEMYVLYSGINHLNLFFFAGNAGDYSWLLLNIPGGWLFVQNVFYSLLPFQIISIIGVLCYIALKDKYQRLPSLLLGLLAIFLFTYSVVIYWDSALLTSITSHIPITPLFRNPKKLIFMVYISYIILLLFIHMYTKSKIYFTVLSTILLVNILAISPLVFDGYSGHKQTNTLALNYSKKFSPQQYDSLFASTYSYPDRFLRLRDLLQKQDGLDPKNDYRIVVVPDNNQSLYQSHLRYLLTPFSVNSSYAIFGGVTNPEALMNVLYSSIINPKEENVQLLDIGNIKYIIVDKKSPYTLFSDKAQPTIRSYYSVFTAGDPEAFNTLLKGKKNLTLRTENAEFYIYENSSFKNTTVSIPRNICEDSLLSSSNTSCDMYIEDAHQLTKPFGTIQNLKQSNLTTYSFALDSSSSGRTIIQFNQTFDPEWELRSTNTAVTIEKQLVGNTYSNAWIIGVPKPGDYPFTITFRSQMIYSGFVIISYVSIFVIILVLIRMTSKGLRKKKMYGK